MTILAPSATNISAVLSPIPLVAPVITATFPSSLPILLVLLLTRSRENILGLSEQRKSRVADR
jgi:hypothetical protein